MVAGQVVLASITRQASVMRFISRTMKMQALLRLTAPLLMMRTGTAFNRITPV